MISSHRLTKSSLLFIPFAPIVISLLLLIISFASSYSSSVVLAARCNFVSQRTDCGSLTCSSIDMTCVPCNASSDCKDAALECVFSEEHGYNECKMVSVKELADNNIGGFLGSILLVFCITSIGSIASLGGGGWMSALINVILGIPLKDSVAIAQAAICGQSSTSLIWNLRRHHPKYQPPGPTRPLVNYQLLFLWLPTAFSGIQYGVGLGDVVPNPIRLLLMFLLFTFVMTRMVEKVRNQRRKDEEEKAKKERLSTKPKNDDDDEDERVPLLKSKVDDEQQKATDEPTVITTYSSINSSPDDRVNTAESKNGKAAATDEQEDEKNTTSPASASTSTKKDNENSATSALPEKEGRPQFPLKVYAMILSIFIPLTIVNIAKESWLSCHKDIIGFWSITAVSTVYCLIIFLIYRRYLAKKREEEGEHAIAFKWNNSTTLLYPFFAFLAGVISPLEGLGGSVVTSFLFVSSGLLPEEVSGTGGLQTFLISSGALVQFVIEGGIRYDFLLVYFGTGLVAAIFAQRGLMPEIKKRGMSYLILVCLATILLGTLLSALSVGIWDTVQLARNDGEILRFGDFCPEIARYHDSNHYTTTSTTTNTGN